MHIGRSVAIVRAVGGLIAYAAAGAIFGAVMARFLPANDANGAKTPMRVKLLRPVGALMLLLFPAWASSNEMQKMTVEELVGKCTAADQSSAAFCSGLATGVLNQLQANGVYLNIATLRIGAISDDTRKALKSAGAVCGAVEPEVALMAFISWAKIHPEFRRYNGITGVATAIAQAWPCKE